MNISNHLFHLHKQSLPKDPIHLFNKEKAISFFNSLYKINRINLSFEKDNLSYFSIVIPIAMFYEFIIIIFLATFQKSLNKRRSLKKKYTIGILVYICIKKELRGRGIGKEMIMSYKKEGYEKLYFITTETTYNLFYKKLGAQKISFLGKTFCGLKL